MPTAENTAPAEDTPARGGVRSTRPPSCDTFTFAIISTMVGGMRGPPAASCLKPLMMIAIASGSARRHRNSSPMTSMSTSHDESGPQGQWVFRAGTANRGKEVHALQAQKLIGGWAEPPSPRQTATHMTCRPKDVRPSTWHRRGAVRTEHPANGLEPHRGGACALPRIRCTQVALLQLPGTSKPPQESVAGLPASTGRENSKLLVRSFAEPCSGSPSSGDRQCPHPEPAITSKGFKVSDTGQEGTADERARGLHSLCGTTRSSGPLCFYTPCKRRARTMVRPRPLSPACVHSHASYVYEQNQVITRGFHMTARSDSVILTGGLAVAAVALGAKYAVQVCTSVCMCACMRLGPYPSAGPVRGPRLSIDEVVRIGRVCEWSLWVLGV